MPVKKQMALSRKTSSVVTMTQVTESRSSLTSLKTITHKRSSSGKMMESWSSPTLALTSPQTWVSGLQAKFLSPPKSPSPKRRIITRRSSVYVKPGWSEKFQSKSPPKGLEFKVPSAAIASVSSKRSRQSAVFQKSSRESVSSRRSSVYRKSSKNDTGNVVALNQEEKLDATKGKKGKSVSPKRKITKLSSPSEKKFKSPLKVTHTRKRNVSELEKEESPEKPAAKRRKQADGKVLSASPSREKKSVKKTITFSPQQKEAKRQVKKTSRKTRKIAQSLSPQRARSTKSEQLTSLEQSSPRKDDESPSPQRAKKASRAKKPAKSPASGKKSAKSPRRPRKTAKSPASPAKGTKSVSPQGTDNFDQRVLTKTGKSPKVPRKVSKTPASSKKVDKTPASSRKSAKSTPKPRKGTRKAAKSLSAKKTRSAKTVLQVSSLSIGDGDDEEEDTAGNNSIISRRQKRKMTTKDDSNQQTPKPKALKLSNTPQHTAKQKSATSAKNKSKKSLTRSGQVKTKKAVSRKSSANEDEVVTSWSSLSFSQFDSVEETPSKKKMQETKHKKTPTKANKIKAEENRITSTPELKIASSGKKSSSAKSARGKKAAGSKSPTKKRSISTPKSTIKANVKSRKSSVKKSASVARASSATERLDISDSLDGSYLEISRQQSNKTSLDSSPSKKRKSATAVRSVEDEKILEILKEAVTTPKSRNKVSTPKSTKISTPKPAKSSKKLTPSKISTPKSATSSKKSIPSKISTPKSQKVTKSATASRSTKVYQVSSDSLMTSETSSRKSIGQMSKATQDRRKSSRSLLTPLTHHSGVASVSRIRSDSMLEGLSNEDQQLSSYNRSARSVLPVAQTSHARTYQEEKSFAQYVEYQGKSGSERYGAQSVERTVGDQVYRAGSFRTERRKGSQEEVEFEEGQWAGGDANNSAVVSEKKEYEDENLNATISTSTYSNRCTIL